MAIVSSNTSPSPGAAQPSSRKAALAVVTSLFFMWGFVTVLNDVLIPHLKSIFDLKYAKASLIQSAFFLAYFLFSLPAAKLIDRVGYKRTMVIGVVVMGIGAWLVGPPALRPSCALFLGALMALAAGMRALEGAATPS